MMAVTGVILPASAVLTVTGEYQLTTDTDWSSEVVDLEYGATVNLNGYNLTIGQVALTGSGDVPVFTDESATPGELRVIAQGNFLSGGYSVLGALSFVKDGPGTLTWSGGTIASTVPISVIDGVFRVGVTTADVFGSDGDIYVSGTGQFDINYGTPGGSAPTLARTFHIEGDGPDGSGALVNSIVNGGWGRHLRYVNLTGDATISSKSSRIDFRDDYGIDGGGHTLTIKGSPCFCLAESATAYVRNCEDVIVDGCKLQLCSSKANASAPIIMCTLDITGAVVLKNGGIFGCYEVGYKKNKTSTERVGITVSYYVPFTVREGDGTIRIDYNPGKNFYSMNGYILVEPGATLTCSTDGPWYNSAVTNQTGGTINIAGEFSALGYTFKNDGLVNHTAGKFVFGHRDNANAPCAVENDGTIRTSGGTLMLKGESRMRGTGTIEVAEGGTASLAGDLTGFTGTILLNGGTTTINHPGTFGGTLEVTGGTATLADDFAGFEGTILLNGGTTDIGPSDAFGGTLVLRDGVMTTGSSLGSFTGTAVIDVKERELPFSVEGRNWMTFSAGKEVFVDTGTHKVKNGDQVLSWTTPPEDKLKFKLMNGQFGALYSTDAGVFYTTGLRIFVR